MVDRVRKKQYRARYLKVMSNMTEIASMKPKKRYMHRLMNTVIFQDFETALDVIIEDYKNASNDNKSA